MNLKFLIFANLCDTIIFIIEVTGLLGVHFLSPTSKLRVPQNAIGSKFETIGIKTLVEANLK